ncbi:hypothetical protein GCM10007269_31710 [Microbacterium murale]|uniref:Uncharacterized protein n=2 Tax=Microbacterium murale TaxID=1081040 RepID=A0ABQ1S0T0_9MICO|nr:hypothetical protein GCM10007269_31710 [Microbacterium murale]
MKPTASKRMKTLLAETSLITKIITGLGLALLLIVGAWSGEIHESEASISTASFAGVPVTTHDLSSVDSAEAATAGTVIGEGSDDSLMLGVAGCLLGIICCVLVLVVARVLSVRAAPRILFRLPRMLALARATGRPFTAPLYLTQLSISRT